MYGYLLTTGKRLHSQLGTIIILSFRLLFSLFRIPPIFVTREQADWKFTLIGRELSYACYVTGHLAVTRKRSKRMDGCTPFFINQLIKMKKIIVLLTLLFTTMTLFAQDIITKRDGEEIQAKVLNINDKEINYIKWTNLNGPTYTISKSEVFMIKYENGEKDVFEQEHISRQAKAQAESTYQIDTTKDLATQMSKNNIDFLKRQDLLKRAKRCKGWGAGLSITIFTGGLVGGILAGVADWSTGATIGYCSGVAVLSIIPYAILGTKGNRLESEAYRIKITSLPIKNIQIGELNIEPNINLMSHQNNKQHALGFGAKILF